MHREHIVLPRARLPKGMTRLPFSDAVRAGDTLYISGRLGLDPSTGRPPESVAQEAAFLMDDVRTVVTAAGLTMNDIVMVTIFAPNVADFAAFNEVYVRSFDGALPARAFIGSGALLFGCRFELTAIAAGAPRTADRA